MYLIFLFFCFLSCLSYMWGKHTEWMDKKHPDLKNKPNEDRAGNEDN